MYCGVVFLMLGVYMMFEVEGVFRIFSMYVF